MQLKIPDGMLNAAKAEYRVRAASEDCVRHILEVALGWLSHNPILPSMEQLNDMYSKLDQNNGGTYIPAYLKEWQRRMFLVPEFPEAIKDLMLPDIQSGFFKPEILN